MPDAHDPVESTANPIADLEDPGARGRKKTIEMDCHCGAISMSTIEQVLTDPRNTSPHFWRASVLEFQNTLSFLRSLWLNDLVDLKTLGFQVKSWLPRSGSNCRYPVLRRSSLGSLDTGSGWEIPVKCHGTGVWHVTFYPRILVLSF